MQRGDILIGNDGNRTGLYTGINIEVWRNNTFIGLLEPSLDYNWHLDPFNDPVRIGVDHMGNVYTGAASSNNSNGGPNIYKWDHTGRFLGRRAETPDPAEFSPWGNDIGIVRTDAGAFFTTVSRCNWILIDKLGFVYVLRWRHLAGSALTVGNTLAVPTVPALAKYDPDGNVLHRYNATHEFAPTFGAGTSTATNIDIEAGDITCDGKTLVVTTATDHLLGAARGFGQILRYDLVADTPSATILYERQNYVGNGGPGTIFLPPAFQGQALSINPQTNEIICLYGTEGPILKLPIDGSRVDTIILPEGSGLLALIHSLDPRRALVANDSDVYLVDLTKPDDLPDSITEWTAKSFELLFTTSTGIARVLGVYNPRDCLSRPGGQPFATVVGAT